MKDFTYSNEQTELIRHLLNYPPDKIWWDYWIFSFDYGIYFIELRCEYKVAASQNSGDEAVISTLERLSKPYKKGKYSHLICENRVVEEAYVLRSLLYFTDYHEFTENELLLRRADTLLKEAVEGTENKIEALLAKTVGVHREISCNPNSELALHANPDYSNLINNGLLLKIGNLYLPAYFLSNFFGFVLCSENKQLFEFEDLEDDFEEVELIKIK